jgi:hypothetical protein
VVLAEQACYVWMSPIRCEGSPEQAVGQASPSNGTPAWGVGGAPSPGPTLTAIGLRAWAAAERESAVRPTKPIADRAEPGKARMWRERARRQMGLQPSMRA